MSHHHIVNQDKLFRYENIQCALGDTNWPPDPEDSRPPLLVVAFEEDGSGWLESFIERDLATAIAIVKEALVPIDIWMEALGDVVDEVGSKIITEVWLRRFRDSMSAPSEENIMLWNRHLREFKADTVSSAILAQTDVLRFEKERLTNLLAQLESLKEKS